ncbi:hypothetical protein DYBT9623_04766 [Dyadobacter sp. CECT 9623]|uniref:Uncharacterized protein n=1 Tax=Dyadobacter linearis TaxID=2823330 RepID=A0ABM8UWV2_9BACT|nr:hypothetical protein DYBT9623_04766 [Dyadobacter sp. CECT 9623]
MVNIGKPIPEAKPNEPLVGLKGSLAYMNNPSEKFKF